MRISEAAYKRASILLLLALACTIALTFRDYGITWDEPMQNRYGSLVIRYYFNALHGWFNLSPITSMLDFAYYGGLFDSVAAAIEHVSPFGEFETRHLLNALVGLFGIVGCWKMARLLGGWSAGFWAVALLALTRYYGHMFNNPKDLPFAAGFVWSLYYLLAAVPLLPKIPWRLCMKLGVAIGLTLGVRVGGLLLLAYLALLQGGYVLYLLVRTSGRTGLGAALADLGKRTLAITAIAWSIMLLLWPWAQAGPFTRPFQALSHFNSMPWNGTVLFRGLQVQAAALPRTYALNWLGITLPEAVLLLLLIAAAFGISFLFKEGLPLFRNAFFTQCAFLAFAVLFPLAYMFVTKPVLYDGERHSLYLVPLIVCLCAIAWSFTLQRLDRSHPRVAIAALSAFALYLAWQTSVMVRLHPQEYVYFNETVGGLRGAAGQYETDYWGNAYREAVKDLVSYLGPEHARDAQKNYTVYMTSTQRVSATYYFPPYLSLTKRVQDADFFLATTRYNIDRTVDGCTVGKVQRFGVVLAVVKDRRCLKPAATESTRANVHAGATPKPL